MLKERFTASDSFSKVTAVAVAMRLLLLLGIKFIASQPFYDHPEYGRTTESRNTNVIYFEKLFPRLRERRAITSRPRDWWTQQQGLPPFDRPPRPPPPPPLSPLPPPWGGPPPPPPGWEGPPPPPPGWEGPPPPPPPWGRPPLPPLPPPPTLEEPEQPTPLFVAQSLPSSPPTGPPAPPLQITTGFLDNPRVKQFINEVTMHTSAFQIPNQGYDEVLRIMQQHFTMRSRSRTLYDGTRIIPNVVSSVHNEFAPNRLITGILFENDMALTVAQMHQINNAGRGREKRKIIADATLRWDSSTIPYRFALNDQSWRSQITKALRYWESETCLRFQLNGQGNDYLYFDRGSGCYSVVGRLGGSQIISIGYGCETMGIISHEIGHALGFWHEQERPERDSYIRINLQYVIPGMEANFEKRTPAEIVNMGVPYDLGSVMHYAANSYANESLRYTVVPLDTRYISTIGNRVLPSFTDIKQINRLYCASKCSSRSPCKNGGYPDPNNCNTCKCPQGLGGRKCTDLQPSSCGSKLWASSTWQTLNYSGSSNCIWHISTKHGGRVRFEIRDVYFKCAPTCEEFVEIKYGNDMELTGFRLCCLPTKGVIASRLSYIIVMTIASVPSRFSLRYISVGDTPPPQPIIRQTTTTERPVVRPVRSWLQWGPWSECSEKCGACGSRTRYRRCSGNSCGRQRSQSQTQRCGMAACEEGATKPRMMSRRYEYSRRKREKTWCCERFIARNRWCYSVI